MKPEETTEERELLDALRTLASEEERLGTPPRVEARLMRAFDEHPMNRQRRLFAKRVLQTAAMLALGVFGTYWWNRGSVEAPARDGQIADAAPVTSWSASDALIWLDPEPESLQIVHVRVAPAVLAAQGYAIGDADSDALVDLEVILGADGMPRGVRVARAGALAY